MRGKKTTARSFLYFMDEWDAAEGSEALDTKMFQHVYTEHWQSVILVDD